MVQSPEYPDLLWMPPKSWDNTNRTSVQVIVIHTTEGSEHGQSAEDGAAYDQRRTDGTSTHFFHDSNSTVQCVHTADQAHAARTQGNKRGIQHELCADAADTWGDDYHQAVLRMAAKQCARDAAKWGIPIKKLTSDQVAAGVKGFCGHVDITNAFPQDNGTHTDPGKNFPWSSFLAMVENEGDPMDQATFNSLMDNYFKQYTTDENGWQRTVVGPAILDHHWMPNPLNPEGGKAPVYDVLRDTAQALADIKAQLAGPGNPV